MQVLERLDTSVFTSKYCIYALCDPDTGEVRYVGKTTDTTKRLKTHIYEAGQGKRSHKSNWIRSLLKGGKEPVVKIIDSGISPQDIDEAEKFWICVYRGWGVRLTNQTDGGGGTAGWVAGEDTRGRMSRAAQKRCQSPDERERLRAIAVSPPPVRIGSENIQARLTEEKVIWLRQQVKSGMSPKEVAGVLEVTTQAAWMAATGKTWTHVAEEPMVSGKRQKLSDAEVAEIRRRVSEGECQAHVARLFGVTPSHVSKTISGARRVR